MVPGFKFNLGFSGKYYHHGNNEEDKGDDLLLQHVDKFMWFSHMWNHQQPHLYDNITLLMDDMVLNKNFAKQYGDECFIMLTVCIMLRFTVYRYSN